MDKFIKKFEDLTTDELFEIYKLRNEVFVVEQQCIYADIDDFDKVSIHVFFKEDGQIISYLRVLPAGTTFDEVSIGRVISMKRRTGLGTATVTEGIRVAKECFGAKVIEIEAQTYVRSLYEKLGFIQTSDEFLEDGIPHIRMRKELD